MNQELIYQIAISELNGVGPVNAKNLLSYCGSLEGVFEASKKELAAIPNIGEVSASKIVKSKGEAIRIAEREVKYLEKDPSIQPVFFTSTQYPNRLKFCADSPLMLYFKGNSNMDAPKVIAMVGTRKMTHYGKKIINQFIGELIGTDVIIISGLAYGVDTYVHKVCVEHSIETIGVLAHGLDRIYPAANRKLAKSMINQGGLLTEYIHETNPDREHFPMRNRIIAGISDATIIVESADKGGSLITGDLAISYNRDVFAFPGKIDDPYSAGCNAFIKQQKALMIENASDLFHHLGWENNLVATPQQRSLFVELTDLERNLVNVLERNNMNAEQISRKSSLPLSTVTTHLLNLELKGVVRTIPGNLYAVN